MGTQLCIYCQRRPATTRDHVPPKLLFPPPRPSSLITVPACKRCNEKASLDDEHFRTYLGARQETENDWIVDQLRYATFRSFDRNPKYYNAWFRETSWVNVVDDFGNVVGRKMQFRRNYDRIEPVIKRIVRGLHFRKFSVPLPVSCPFIVVDHGGFDALATAPGTPLADLLAEFRAEPATVVDKYVFSYKRLDVVGDDTKSVWLLTFFRRLWFLVYVNVNEADYRDKLKPKPRAPLTYDQ